MTNDVTLQNALTKLAEAEATVLKWRNFIDTYKELQPTESASSARVPRKTRGKVGQVTKRRGKGRAAKVPATPKSKNIVEETETMAVMIIEERNGPVTTAELLQKMTSFGFEIGGKHPQSTLLTRLTRSKRLTNVKGKGWVLVNVNGEAPSSQPSNEGALL